MKKLICMLLVMLSATVVFANERYNFVDLLDMVSVSGSIKSANGASVDSAINRVLDKNPDYLNKTFYQDTLLNAAASAGRVDLMKNLIKRGARLDVPEAQVPMISAAMFGRVNVIEYLLSIGDNPNKQHFVTLQTPLMVAITFNQDEVVDLLLQQNDIDVNLVNNSNKTALQIAFKYKRYDYCEKLLKKGAKPNEKLVNNEEFAKRFGKYIINNDTAYDKLKTELDKVFQNINITYNFG